MCNESRNSGGWWNEGCGCDRNLKVHSLCAKCVKADEVCAHCLKAGQLEAGSIKADSECVSGDLQASQLHADQGFFNKLCAKEGTINKLCVDQLTVSNPAVLSTPYRATVNYSVDTSYTLGTFLNFDNIVDDPNNNISLLPNTSYTAPKSGYYMMSFKVNIDSLLTSTGDPILGVPVANPVIYVNGLLVREAYSPFLSFFNTQKVIVDSLITLQAGDVVTMKYDVLAGNGLAVAGTVNIVGAGIEDGNSLFKIIFLSDLSQQTPGQECQVCPDVVVECDEEPCDPCHNGLRAPVLNAIEVSPEAPSDYNVSWSFVHHAHSYTLQQSASSDFSSPTTMKLGNTLFKLFANQPNGTYYYRVLASNLDGSSPYSNVQSVVVNAPAAAAAARPARVRVRSSWVKPRS